jgi:hypothetical protein
MRALKIVVYLMAAITACDFSSADIGPIPGTQRVQPVFEQADVVCNCVVESLRTVSEEKMNRGGKDVLRRQIVATVLVKDTYKPNVSSGMRINVQFEADVPPAFGPTLYPGESALLFLRRETLAVYAIADRYMGVTPFGAIPPQQGNPSLQKLQGALSGILMVDNDQDQIHALRLLEGMNDLAPAALVEVDRLSGSANPEVAFAATAVLVKANSAGALDRLTALLRGYSGSSNPVGLMSVSVELAKITDPKQLPQLEQLSSSKYLSIRFGALGAIRRMRDPRSAQALVARLNDPDKNIRYEAVTALAEIFGKTGDYSPALFEFDRKPDFYVDLWKTWWGQQEKTASK